MSSNILDDYLSKNGSTRYQVMTIGKIANSTLVHANERAKDASGISTRILIAIGKTIHKSPGKVLDELIAADIKAGRTI